MSDPLDTDIPEALKKHRQLQNASCAVSAFEAIAKLHGLIPLEAFPLQRDPAKQLLGFEDTSFLKSHGLEAKDEHLSVRDAVERLEKETNAGRFPLAVQITGRVMYEGQLRPVAHTFLCALHNGRFLLIDPAFPKIQAEGRGDIAKEFQSKIDTFGVRNTIHVLTYRKV